MAQKEWIEYEIERMKERAAVMRKNKLIASAEALEKHIQSEENKLPKKKKDKK